MNTRHFVRLRYWLKLTAILVVVAWVAALSSASVRGAVRDAQVSTLLPRLAKLALIPVTEFMQGPVAGQGDQRTVPGAQAKPGAPAQPPAGDGMVSLIVKTAPGLSDDGVDALVTRGGGKKGRGIGRLRLHVVRVPQAALEGVMHRFKEDPDVERVEVEQRRQIAQDAVQPSTVTDPGHAEQWALETIRWNAAWSSVTPVGSARIAVLDTGVSTAGGEINVVDGWSAFGTDPKTDANGHGTWVASIAAAVGNNAKGIAGVSFSNTSVMPVQVLDANGQGQDSDIIDGVLWAVENNADVILMAFSNPGYSQSLQDAIDLAWANGIVVVAAAGNEASSTPTFPAGDSKVVGVAATDQADGLWAQSNFGKSAFVAAPGVGISGLRPDGSVLSTSGTSASSALVAGAAALLKIVDPTASNGVIVGRLARNADPAGTQEQTGNGRLNIERALADVSVEAVVPVGAPPEGDGGPFVGPYAAAACTPVAGTFTIGAQNPTPIAPGGSATYEVSVEKSNGNCSANFSNLSVTGLPPGATVTGAIGGGGSLDKATGILTISTTAATPNGVSNLMVSVASQNGNFTAPFSGPTTLRVGKGTPVVTWNDPAGIVYGTALSATQLNATASVAGSFAYTPAAGTVLSAGDNQTLSVLFTPTDTASYDTATKTVQIDVSNASQTIAITQNAPATAAYNTTFEVKATGGASGNAIAFTAVAGSVCSVGTTSNAGGVFTAAVTMTSGTGTCQLALNQAGNDNYAAASQVLSATATAAKAALTITANSRSKDYGQAATFAGTEFTTAPSQLQGTDTVTSVTLTSTGAAASASVAGGPYSIVASQAVGTGLSNYTISYVPGTLTVTAVPLTVTADSTTKTYGAALPAFTADYAGFVNGDTAASLSGTLAFATAATAVSAVGSYDVTPSGLTASNYAISFVKGTLTVEAAPVTVTADAKTITYGDAEPALTYQVTAGSLVAGDAFTGALTRAAGTAVGSYAIDQGSLALSTNYTLTFVGANLTIETRKVTVTADAKTITYGDAEPALTYQVTAGSLVAGDAFTGALTRAAGTAVGSYAIDQGSLALSANYTLTFVGANLTIETRKVTVTADAKTITYGDAEPALTYQVTAGSLVAGDAFTGALTRAAGTAVGSYAIDQGSLALSTNYTLTFVGANLTIETRKVTVTADAKTITYGDAEPALTYQVTAGSLVAGDAFTGALTRAAGTAVGSYAIDQGSLALSTNYTLTFVGANLTIETRKVTVTADAKTKIYGEADPALTYAITSGTLGFSDAFTGSLTRAAGQAVGDYAIGQGTLALSTNYTLTFVGANLTITPRLVTITADAKTKIYGEADPALTYAITSGTLGFSDAFTGSLTRAAGQAVGDYAIGQGTLALSTNYTLTFAGANLTIGRAPLAVTAHSTSKNFGSADPVFTYQVSGLKSSDTVATVLTGGLVRDAGEAVGSYAIRQGTLVANANYTILFTAGSLTIIDWQAPAALNVGVAPNPVQINTAFKVSATIDDSLTGNTNIQSAGYTVNDGVTWTPLAGIFTSPVVAVEATHAGLSSAVYQVCVRGTDIHNNIGQPSCTLLAVFDPSGGFVTGGGFIDSPAGASVQFPLAVGRANFGFVSKYQKGAKIPTGETEFQFKAGSLNFHSSVYEWLVVAGARAQYKGEGTINGAGRFGFLLTAIDGQAMGGGGVDKFRIKIWNFATGVVVYDNQMGASDDGDASTALSGGSIVIHQPPAGKK